MFNTRQALITVAAVLVVAPVAYYVSGEWRSSATIAEMAPIAAEATGTVALPSASTANSKAPTPEPEALTSEEFGTRVTEKLPALRRAYTAALRKNPDLMGSLSLRIRMDDSGNVLGAEAERLRLSDSDFAEVVVAEARKWRFVKHNGSGGVFTVPLLFVPEDMDPRTILRWQKTVAAEEGNANLVRPLKLPRDSSEESDRNQTVTRGVIGEGTAKGVVSKSNKTPERTVRVTEYKTRRMVPLREEPRFSSETSEHIGPGTPISVVETKGDWVKIKTRPAGSIGYVRKEYVAPVSGVE